MAFSIFSKTGPQDARKPSAEGEKTGLKSPTALLGDGPGPLPGRPGAVPEMMAYEVAAPPPLQEAAILFAANHQDAAQALLRSIVQDKTSNDPQPWLMLLDLYKYRGLKRDFEDLAMAYTIKFERSPPTWDTIKPEARKETRAAGDYFALQSREQGIAGDIKKLDGLATKAKSIRLDLGKLKALSAEDANQLAGIFAGWRKRAVAARFTNAGALIELLKRRIADNPARDHLGIWLVLFEIYQRLGMQVEFEELGLEYAIAFESSPPSWDPAAAPPAQTDGEAAPIEAPDKENEKEGFMLRSSLGVDDGVQLQQLLDYGAGHSEVRVSMAALQRIEFAATGAFIDALSKLKHAGKTVVLADVSELVHPLLEAFQAAGVAQLQKRKTQ